MKELKMIMNDDGVFEEYDETYDLTIHCTSQEEQDEVLLRLNKTVEQLPPVTPAEKVGKIVEGGYDCEHFVCSECGQDFGWFSKPNHNYCPNCGAKMGGEQNEVSD